MSEPAPFVAALALAEPEDLRAHEPARPEPPRRAHRRDEHDQRDPLPEREQEQEEEEPRDREGRIHQPHRDGVHRAAAVPGDEPHQGPHPDGHRDGNRRDRERDARPAGHAREHVAAQLVGAHGVRPAGRLPAVLDVRLGDRTRQHERTRHGAGDHHREHQDADPSWRAAPDGPEQRGERAHACRTRGSRSAYSRSARSPPATTSALASSAVPIRSG